MKVVYESILLCAISIFLCACNVKEESQDIFIEETNNLSELQLQDEVKKENDNARDSLDDILNPTFTPIPKEEMITDAPIVSTIPHEDDDVCNIIPTITTTPFPQQSQSLEVNIKDAKRIDWTELVYYVNKEDSIRNSNLLNYGYLTYDGDYIYYVDRNSGGIYVSDFWGKEKKCLSKDSGRALQASEEWIFYKSDEGSIKRLHKENGMMERIYELPCGEFILAENKIYINASEGFCVINLDGSNKEILMSNTEFQKTNFSTCNGFWISNLVNGTDAQWFWKGYLLGYDRTHNEHFLFNQQGMYPLLAGNMISVFDVNTFTRHIWNMETKVDTDIGIYAHRIVSDGEAIYYTGKCREEYALYCWVDGEIKELDCIEAINAEFSYLTNNMVYWMPTVSDGMKSVLQLWYYDIVTGETGKIY